MGDGWRLATGKWVRANSLVLRGVGGFDYRGVNVTDYVFRLWEETGAFPHGWTSLQQINGATWLYAEAGLSVFVPRLRDHAWRKA